MDKRTVKDLLLEWKMLDEGVSCPECGYTKCKCSEIKAAENRSAQYEHDADEYIKTKPKDTKPHHLFHNGKHEELLHHHLHSINKELKDTALVPGEKKPEHYDADTDTYLHYKSHFTDPEKRSQLKKHLAKLKDAHSKADHDSQNEIVHKATSWSKLVNDATGSNQGFE